MSLISSCNRFVVEASNCIMYNTHIITNYTNQWNHLWSITIGSNYNLYEAASNINTRTNPSQLIR